MYEVHNSPKHWKGVTGGSIAHLSFQAFCRDSAHAYATWHNDDSQLVARCSLWWSDTPILNGRRIGTIGHYAALDPESAVQLLTHACQTLKQEGYELAVGPMDGNTWRNYRTAIGSVDRPPFFLEPNYPARCATDFSDAGFSPIANYRSTICDDLNHCDPRAIRVQTRMDGMNVGFRCFSTEQASADLRAIYDLTLLAYRHSFLFEAITFQAFQDQFQPLLERIEPEWIQLAEHDGNLVGFVFGAPDLLQSTKIQHVNTAILKTLAVRPERPWAGLGMLLLQRFHAFARERGFARVIHALMHDGNSYPQLLSSRYAKPLRKYALFARDLS